MLRTFFALGLMTALVAPSPAAAQACPQLPSLISAPCKIVTDGDYQLAGSIDGTGRPQHPTMGHEVPVIEIGSGVALATINCNDYRIENNGSPWVARGVGIGGYYNANITIKNCRFVGTGMMLCVQIDNWGDQNYRNVTVERSACSATWMGFYVRSHGFRAFDNYLTNIGGHTNCYAGSYNFAIQWWGDDAEIKRNKIRRVWNRCFTEVVGIAAADMAKNFDVADNEVENNHISNSASIGIWFGPNSWGRYSGNKVIGWHYGYLAGYPAVAASELSGTSLIVGANVPIDGFNTPPVGSWTISP